MNMNDFKIENGVLKKYKGSGGAVIIPDSVTSIGERAFWGCESLTSVTIPDSVTSIGGGAFGRCESLTSVTVPNGVTSIGEYAFSECKNLTSVTVLNGITNIGDSAFSWCSSLTSVTIPDSVTSIGEDAFSECKSLTSVTIPDSVTSIVESAFGACVNLTMVICSSQEVMNHFYEIFGDCPIREITISDNINTIGVGNYGYDISKVQVHFSEHHKTGVLYATDGTLIRYSDKVDTVTIESSDIDESAFLDCHNLKNVIFPLEVFKDVSREWDIDDFFNAASNISSIIIKIPENMTYIKKHTFTEEVSDWWHYTDVDRCLLLPDNVKHIEEDAFFLGYPEGTNTNWQFSNFIDKIFWHGAEFDFDDCFYNIASELYEPEPELLEDSDMSVYEYYDLWEQWYQKNCELDEKGFYSVLNCLFKKKYDELPDSFEIQRVLINIFIKNPTDEKLFNHIMNFEDIDYNTNHFLKLLETLIENHYYDACQKLLEDVDIIDFMENMFEEDDETVNDETVNREKIIQYLLTIENIFTKDNIDECIQYAIDNKKYEIQVLLTNYKREKIGYSDPAEKL